MTWKTLRLEPVQEFGFMRPLPDTRVIHESKLLQLVYP